MARRRRRRRAAGGLLRGFSVQLLHAELRRRERGVGKLERRRDRLMERVAELDDMIRAAGGRGRRGRPPGRRGGGRGRVGRPRGRAGRRGRRPRNEMSLEEALARVLSGKTMSVTEAAGAVRAAGYRTGAANFRTMVNAALIRSDKIKKVSRGQYTAK